MLFDNLFHMMSVVLALLLGEYYKNKVRSALRLVGDTFDDRIMHAAFAIISWKAISCLEWYVMLIVVVPLLILLFSITRIIRGSS